MVNLRRMRVEDVAIPAVEVVAVPVDITKPEDGYADPEFGGARLKHTLVEKLPDAYRQTFLNLEDVMSSLRSLHHRQAVRTFSPPRRWPGRRRAGRCSASPRGVARTR
ncbi:MAG: hypothetical protein HC814_06005 [Rhodobacteraceae bacterium]|nr:hypothetical protein [Paracoccaceae bacterium]